MTRTEPLDSNHYARCIAEFVLREHLDDAPNYGQLFYIPDGDETADYSERREQRSRNILDGLLRDYEAAKTRELIASMPD